MTKVRAGTAYGCAPSGCNGPKEGQCIDLCSLHRVTVTSTTDMNTDQGYMQIDAPLGIMKYDAVEFAAPEPIDFGSYRPLVIAGVVLCIAGLFTWWLS